MQTSHDKARFVLKDSTSGKPTLVFLLYRYRNQRLKYSTGQTVDPVHWDTKTQQALANQKSRAERQTYDAINAELNRYSRVLKKIIAQCKLAEVEPTIEQVREYLDKEFKPVPVVKAAAKPETFFEYVDRFIEECKAGKRLTKEHKRFAEATVKDYRKTLNHLIEYQKVYDRRLDYEAFTMTFYDKFKKSLTSRGYSLNTIGALIKNLKILLKHAYRDGLHNNVIFQHEDFKKIQEETDSIYLADEELQRMYDLNLSNDLKLDRVRDLFLIGCYTGLRFSDYNQLRLDNITNGGQIITVTTKKTGIRVSIPLNSKVLAILAKYDYDVPRLISNQKFNEYLKEVAKLTGINESAHQSRTKGGLKVTQRKEKWELVTSHTARRSFATNAYKNGVSTLDIMRLTGHKTESSFMKYIKVTGEETAVRLLAHPHFQGSALKVVN